jgi:hypothetical protein
MDLMDFDQTQLYFDDPIGADVDRLLHDAGARYGEDEAEMLLLRAYLRAPEALVTLVALYRFYFYQHRLEDALSVAERALAVAGRRLGLPSEWRQLHPEHIGHAVLRSMGLLRFYLMVLKAAGYVELRLGHSEAGQARLRKLTELDSHDRLGGRALLDLARESMAATTH